MMLKQVHIKYTSRPDIRSLIATGQVMNSLGDSPVTYGFSTGIPLNI